MNEFLKISEAWFEILPRQQFSAFFDIMFLPWTDALDAVFDSLILTLSGNAILGGVIEIVLEVLKSIPNFGAPCIVVLFGYALFFFVAIHTVKLVVEALPII